MQARTYIDTDYVSVAKWWLGHKWPVVEKKSLPKTGFIVDNVCAGFLYKTDSSIAWLEFIIANPRSSKEERSEGLNAVIEAAIKHASDEGFTTVFSSLQHPGLINRFKEHGFQERDNNMTNVMRTI